MAIPCNLLAEGIRQSLDERRVEGQGYQNEEIRLAMNRAYQDVWIETAALDRYFNVKVGFISLVADQSVYPTPADLLLYVAINNVEGGRRPYQTIRWKDIEIREGVIVGGTQELRIVPTPTTNVTDAVELVYYFYPIPVTFGRVIKADTNKLTLEKLEVKNADHYITQSIQIISGPGTGESITAVTSYDGRDDGNTAKECVGTAAWSVTPTDKSEYSTSLVLPDSAFDAIRWGACVKLKTKEEGGRTLGMFKQEYREALHNYLGEMEIMLMEGDDVFEDVMGYGEPYGSPIAATTPFIT